MRTSETIDRGVTAPAVNAGSVILRGVTIALDTEVGRAFVIDCARNTEGLIPDAEISDKYGLSDGDWEQLAGNTPVLHAVRAERERRIANGDAAKEGAQRYFAKAPTILGDILTDNLVSPRHRIEAAKELRQVAGNSDTTQVGGEKFTFTINLGEDAKLHYEIAPLRRSLPDEGEHDE
jgi:hypothetical protein